MKREYEAPMMHCEEFVSNQYIAGCGDTNITAEINFKCFNGMKIDGHQNVLSDSAESTCKIQAKYVSATEISKPHFTKGSAGSGLTNKYGFFVICHNEKTGQYDKTEWGNGVHSGNHAVKDMWHCMATPAGEGEIELHHYS